ncbi:MAG: zinc metallochaperone AztD [Rhizobiaceae bacterium]
MNGLWKLGTAFAALMAVAGGAAAEEKLAWRLFVSDHAAGKVTVIDALAGRTLDTVPIKGPASLYRTDSGRTVFAVQGPSGVVQAISTGIAFEDHGDHGDIDVTAPRLVDLDLAGGKPAHFVERRGRIAQWFDGEDRARFLAESDVLDGRSRVRTASVFAAHHGVAVPYGDHAVVSIPNPEDAGKRPIGARVIDFEGRQVGADAPCPGLHGSAGSGDLHALACDTGLLLIREQGGVPEITHLPYASSLPEGSSSTLIGGEGLRYFVGNYGADRVVLIDPAAGADAFRLVQLPTRRVHFAVDPIRPRFAYVLTEDGQLHRIDVIDGKLAGSLRLTEPYSMDGHSSDPRPRVAVAGDRIVVTDPLKGLLHLVDAEGFRAAGEIAVEGRPFNIVAVGGAGQSHATE